MKKGTTVTFKFIELINGEVKRTMMEGTVIDSCTGGICIINDTWKNGKWICSENIIEAK